MKPINFNDDSYMGIEIFGKQALFTNMRIDRDTVPKELYAYDCRDDDSTGEICEIAEYVLANHWGTIFFLEPIENFVPKENLSEHIKTKKPIAYVYRDDTVVYTPYSIDIQEFIKNGNFRREYNNGN